MVEQNITNWLDKEAETLKTPLQYEELPSLKLAPNVVTELEVDFSKPFQAWTGESGGKTVTKKIIPVVLSGTRMNWWLNVKNPIYREVINLGKSGISKLKVMQTGTKADTKYILVK